MSTSSTTVVVTFDDSHKTTVAVCRCGSWRRVVLRADRPKLLAAAAAHVRAERCAEDDDNGRVAHELARRAERSDKSDSRP